MYMHIFFDACIVPTGRGKPRAEAKKKPSRCLYVACMGVSQVLLVIVFVYVCLCVCCAPGQNMHKGSLIKKVLKKMPRSAGGTLSSFMCVANGNVVWFCLCGVCLFECC